MQNGVFYMAKKKKERERDTATIAGRKLFPARMDGSELTTRVFSGISFHVSPPKTSTVLHSM